MAMPPVTKGRKQFTKLQVERAKTISRARIHIERAIGRVKGEVSRKFEVISNPNMFV